MISNKDNVVLRQDKAVPLTHQEGDQNFIELKNVIDDVEQLDQKVPDEPIQYVGGLVVSSKNQTYVYEDVYYQPSATVELPFTTTNWGADQGSFVSVGDAVLRGDLSLLSGIKDLKPIVGIVQNVKGFYQGSDVGGGQFYYDPDKPKSEHNGGTVIAPEALVAWDGSHSDLATLFNWTGVGDGCFIRKYSFLLATYFGSIPDGMTDSYLSYTKLRSAFPRAKVYWPDVSQGLGYATSQNLLMDEPCGNIGGFGGENHITNFRALGNHAIFEIKRGLCEIGQFRLFTNGDREIETTRGIFINGIGVQNYKTDIYKIYSGSQFNTLIYTNTEIDQSSIRDIVTFHNHKRGAIDIDTSAAASAPTGAAKLERIWITPTDFNPNTTPPSLFGVRMGRTDSCSIENSIINDTQNDILIDNRGATPERNWVLRIANLHSEKRRYPSSMGRWEPSQSVVQGSIIVPTKERANGYAYRALNSGTTAATEPTWPENSGIGNEPNVIDNNITWEPFFSSTSIRFVGSVSSSTQIESIQSDDHLVTILDVGNNIDIKSIRVFGTKTDKIYRRTNNTGLDTTLDISKMNSTSAAGYDLVQGSTATWINLNSASLASGYFGLPAGINISSRLENSRKLNHRWPSHVDLTNGQSTDLASFNLVNNSRFTAFIGGSLSLRDDAFATRGFSSFTCEISAYRIASGSPVVALTPVLKSAGGDRIISCEFTSQFIDGVLIISAEVETDLPSGVIRRLVTDVEILSSGSKLDSII